MVIGDLNFMRVAVFPSEADAPLTVDADAVLTLAVASEGLEMVAGWNAK